MNSFWVGVLGGISVPAIIAVIGLMFKEHILLRLSESVKKKNQLEIETAKGEILKTVEANKAQHLKDIESVKSTLNKDLEKFRQDYDRSKVTDDRKHQIAQEAYRSFFTNKMQCYIKLSQLKAKYLREIDNFVPDDYVDSTENELNAIPYTVIKKIKKNINNNKFYFTKDLVNLFDIWQKDMANRIVEIDRSFKEEWDRISYEMQDTPEYINAYFQESRHSKILTALKESNAKWVAVLNQIDLDIEQLKNKYDI